MSRFPGLREAVMGRRLARRGVTWRDVTASERPPYPSERPSAWRSRYHALPVSAQLGEVK